jgi:hypothetical protein
MHTHIGILFSHIVEWIYAVKRWMDRTGEHNIKWSKQSLGRQSSHVSSHV